MKNTQSKKISNSLSEASSEASNDSSTETKNGNLSKKDSLEKNMSSKSSSLALFLLFSFLLAADQLTKQLATKYLDGGEIVKVLDGIFNFTLVFNPGAAFGMFSGLPDFQRRAVLALVSLIALGVVFYMLRETKNDKISQFALTSILAGAFGNFIDRFRYDAVVDFLDFYIQDYHWPAFNVADSAISVGVVILMIRLIFFHEEENH